MTDKYATFDELKRSELADAYRIDVHDLGSRVAIVAPHAGGIEPGTSEVSLGIAAGDISLYLFEGMKRKGNSDLHITSTNFDEPRCLQLVKTVEVAMTVHGEGSDREAVYIGGRHLELRERVRAELAARGFRAERHESPRLQGSALQNICNRCSSGLGVQLEISFGLRRTFFDSLSDARGRSAQTDEFARFNQGVRAALASMQLI